MPRDGSATRQRILDTAERLVIDNGFAGTSVDQVVVESGTSKGAFFHHFPSKVDLARSLVARYAATDRRQLAQSGTNDQIVEAIKAWRTELSALIRQAAAALPAPVDVDAEALADRVFVTFEGAHSSDEPGHLRAQLTVLRQLLSSLLSQPQ